MEKRCQWVDLKDPLYIDYHDKEWGIPLKDDLKLFAMLNLEGAQAGLSWRTVLHKRENYLKAFSNFDPKKLIKFSPKRKDKLLTNAGIIRNRLKIQAVFTNAESYLNHFPNSGDFSDYLWSYVDYQPIQNKFKSLKEVPAKTEISDALSKDLKKKGFKFVGSTICYAFMQAVGMVNDHEISCDFY
jgi:DNA-3-methyladenine glycosylase I